MEVANVVSDDEAAGARSELDAVVCSEIVYVDVGFCTTVTATVTVFSAYENGACARRSENAKNESDLIFANSAT